MAGKSSENSCIKQAPAQIRAALARGDDVAAIFLANGAELAAIAAGRKGRTTAENMLVNAAVAGTITALAMSLAERPVPMPLGYKGDIPTARDLQAVFEETLSKSLARLSVDGGTAGA